MCFTITQSSGYMPQPWAELCSPFGAQLFHTNQILARISGFSEEVEGFKARYGKDYQTINNEFKKANENFKKFDDLMAWQFAQEGKEYWQGRLKELNNAPHHSDLISFPHHRHLENTEVTASTERNLPEIFLVIREGLNNS